MPRYQRVPGGERNDLTGTRWSRNELKIVLDAYLNELEEGVGVHEHNPVVHKVSKKLGRTVRSVEAQMLMFRNLDKFGDYSWRHMSNLCLELWREHLEKERG